MGLLVVTGLFRDKEVNIRYRIHNLEYIYSVTPLIRLNPACICRAVNPISCFAITTMT